MSCVNNYGDINETFIIEPLLMTASTETWTACTGVYTNLLINCEEDVQIALISGQTIFNAHIIPNQDATLDLGTSSYRFRSLNIVSGISATFLTTDLNVRNNYLTLNYNPSASTESTSIGSGWVVQDGNGISGGTVTFDIRSMSAFSGYTGTTGYDNRGWVTQLNDIVIRSSNPTIPNGVRVLAEGDFLDGGVY